MTTAIRVWLDDVRPAPEGWKHVTTPEEVIMLMQTDIVLEMSLDHDLGLTEERTGYKVLVWLEEAVATRAFVPPPKIVIHSANAVGRKRMEQALASGQSHLNNAENAQ